MPKGRTQKRSKKREWSKATVVRIKPGNTAKASKRVCGDCTACCSAMAVPTIDKPAFTPCSRLNTPETAPTARPGCNDYENRPASCRDFRCAWLDGFPMTGSGDRPDRLGLVLVPTIDPQVIQVREVWENASSETRAQGFITELRRAGLRVELVSPAAQRTLQPLTIFGRPMPTVRATGPARQSR